MSPRAAGGSAIEEALQQASLAISLPRVSSNRQCILIHFSRRRVATHVIGPILAVSQPLVSASGSGMALTKRSGNLASNFGRLTCCDYSSGSRGRCQ